MTALRIAGWIGALIVAQVLIVFASLATREQWLLAPLMPGLYSMKLLPADPRTAGSFIVFPTHWQILLALAVNVLVYGALLLALRSWRSRRPDRPSA